MQKEGLTNADFAKKIGISTSSLSHIFSGRNNPSLDVVMCIHKACPYVNLYWLLYGEGEMEGGSENPEPNSGDWLPLQSSENLQNPKINYESKRLKQCLPKISHAIQMVERDATRMLEKKKETGQFLNFNFEKYQ